MSREILTDWIRDIKAADDAQSQATGVLEANRRLASVAVAAVGPDFWKEINRELSIQAEDCKAIGVLVDVADVGNKVENSTSIQARCGFPVVRRAKAALFYQDGGPHIRVIKTPDADRIEDEESKMRLLVTAESQLAAYYEGADLSAASAATAIIGFLVRSVRDVPERR